MSDSPLAVEAAGVCRRYGRRWALVDVGFVAPRGTTLVVAGRNGSGKSTLLRVLSTAIRPDRGTARIEGFDGHHSNLYEALTAFENLQVAARFLGRDASRKALLEALAEVSLADRADDPVLTFSAGMRKSFSTSPTVSSTRPASAWSTK